MEIIRHAHNYKVKFHIVRVIGTESRKNREYSNYLVTRCGARFAAVADAVLFKGWTREGSEKDLDCGVCKLSKKVMDRDIR